MEERLRAQWRVEEPYRRSWLLPHRYILFPLRLPSIKGCHRKGFYLAASGGTIGLGTLDNTALLVQEGQVLLLLLLHLLHPPSGSRGGGVPGR